MGIKIETNHDDGNCVIKNSANIGAIKEVEICVLDVLKSLDLSDKEITISFDIFVSNLRIETNNDKLNQRIKNMLPC